jgi:O-antigen ligase
MILRYKIFLLILFFGSLIYTITGFTGIDILGKVGNISLVILAGSLIFTINIKNIPFGIFHIFFFFILFSAFNGVINGDVVGVMPSLFRFLMYTVSFFIGWLLLKQGKRKLFLKIISSFTLAGVITTILFGFDDVLSNNISISSGQFRLSGQFEGHALAFAMYILVIFILFYKLSLKQYQKDKKIIKILISYILLIGLIYLLFLSGSRLLLFSIIIVVSLDKLLSSSSFLKTLGSSVLVFLIIFSTYNFVMYTDLAPRMKWLINDGIEKALLPRTLIATEALSSFDYNNSVFGIGLGGFDRHYFSITGRPGVAAHNNYLQFFVEGGIVGLLSLFIFNLIVTIKLFYYSIKTDDVIIRLGLLLFVGIDIISFLNNNYYFPFSQSIVWLVLGASFCIIHERNRTASTPHSNWTLV